MPAVHLAKVTRRRPVRCAENSARRERDPRAPLRHASPNNTITRVTPREYAIPVAAVFFSKSLLTQVKWLPSVNITSDFKNKKSQVWSHSRKVMSRAAWGGRWHLRSAAGDHGSKMKLFKRRLSFSGDKQKRVSRTDDPFEHEVGAGTVDATRLHEIMMALALRMPCDKNSLP